MNTNTNKTNTNKVKNILAFVGLSVAALCGSADTSIDEDLTLNADLDLRNQGAVAISAGVTVNLNGHNLLVKGLSCAGEIVDSAVGTSYQLLEYIESTGKQWIDTDYLTTDKTAIEIDFELTSAFVENSAFYCGDWAAYGHLLVWKTIDKVRRIDFYGKGNTISPATSGRYRFVTVPGATDTAVLYNGTTGEQLVTSRPSLTHNGSGTMLLFAGRSQGQFINAAAYRLYGFKLTNTDTGKVERDYVPVQRLSDGEIGLYDRTYGVFYPSEGTEPFVAGAPTCSGGELVVDTSDNAVYEVSGACYVPVEISDGSELSSDCDLRCFGKNLKVGGTVELNGCRLSVAGLGGVGIIRDFASSPSGASGEVLVDVPEGNTVRNASVELQGNLRLVKTGKGTFVAALNGQTYTGGTFVREGVLKPEADMNTTPFGAANSVLTVEKGAQYCDDVYAPEATQNLFLRIAGTGPDGTGAIRTMKAPPSGVNNADKPWCEGLELLDDAEIARDAYAFSLIADNHKTHPVTFNGHTLTFTSDTLTVRPNYPFLLVSSVCGTSGDTGTIVAGDNIQFYPYKQYASELPNHTLVITEKAEYSTGTDTNARDLTVSNLIYRSSSSSSQNRTLTTVLGCYAPVSTTSAPKVQLGDATHLSTMLDLSERTTTVDVAFGGGLTFADGSVVIVRLGNRHPTGEAKKLLSWTSRPQGVKFVNEKSSGGLLAQEDGLYFISGMTIMVR